jgi:hypothetical protein
MGVVASILLPASVAQQAGHRDRAATDDAAPHDLVSRHVGEHVNLTGTLVRWYERAPRNPGGCTSQKEELSCLSSLLRRSGH